VRERFGAASLRVRDPTDFAQCLRLVDREDNKTLEAREVRCHDHAELSEGAAVNDTARQ